MTLELAPGERLLWEGRPRGLRGFFRAMDFLFIVFAVFAALFFVTGTASLGRQRDPSELVFVALFPILFIGVFLLAPRLISVWRESSGTSYALTDRRIIIRNRSRTIELDLRNLPYLELERSWISGANVYFGQRNMYEGWGGLYGGSPTPAFRSLPDPDGVYQMVSSVRGEAGTR